MRRIGLFVALLWSSCGGGAPEPTEHEPDHDAPLASVVRLSATAMARAGIAFAEVEAVPLADGIAIPAEVQLDPDRVVHVASLAPGQVAEVRASIGERVEEGQILAVIRSVDLGRARADLAEARAELEVAEATATRQEALTEAGIGAGRGLVEARGALRSARARVAGLQDRVRIYGSGGGGATMLLRASIAGEIVERHATVGEVVAADRTLFVIADPSVVWIVGRAYAQDIDALHVDGAATLTLPAQPARVFAGTLDWIAPVLEEATRALPVRMVLPNPDGALRPGLFGTLRVARAGATATPTVQAAAVQQLEGRSVVFVPTDTPDELRVRAITVGRTAEGRTEVIDGLELGDRYVSEHAFVLKSHLLRSRLEGDDD
ncbi:MAG: efflux RND transporter periplasmic adaptor subunit [Sandaracinaceae bacterium]|nr:efflux RND transporter periplasmic adaptor subunit [Sandaracinaceae bacterium]